jgi:hypothetical protein
LLASGATLGDLVADTLAHPGDALPNLMKAFFDLGRTMKDVVQTEVIQPSEDAARRALAALKAIGKSALEVLNAAFEIGGSAVMLVFGLILEWFPGDYRPLTATEHAEAAKVFGNAPQLDAARIAEKTIPEDIIEKINGGRALTAMYVLNFPSGKVPDMSTLIHELTHVWQGVQIGPLYMIEAIEAQLSKAGYNYGFVDGPGNSGPGWDHGQGGEAALNAANGNFKAFNAEQQAMIIQHYYDRLYVQNPSLDVTAWQPYANLVKAA